MFTLPYTPMTIYYDNLLFGSILDRLGKLPAEPRHHVVRILQRPLSIVAMHEFLVIEREVVAIPLLPVLLYHFAVVLVLIDARFLQQPFDDAVLGRVRFASGSLALEALRHANDLSAAPGINNNNKQVRCQCPKSKKKKLMTWQSIELSKNKQISRQYNQQQKNKNKRQCSTYCADGADGVITPVMSNADMAAIAIGRMADNAPDDFTSRFAHDAATGIAAAGMRRVHRRTSVGDGFPMQLDAALENVVTGVADKKARSCILGKLKINGLKKYAFLLFLLPTCLLKCAHENGSLIYWFEQISKSRQNPQ